MFLMETDPELVKNVISILCVFSMGLESLAVRTEKTSIFGEIA